jgi:hypothetical protein
LVAKIQHQVSAQAKKITFMIELERLDWQNCNNPCSGLKAGGAVWLP